MASRGKKKIGFRTEEELADVVREIVNDSDSDTEAATHDITCWNITEGMF